MATASQQLRLRLCRRNGHEWPPLSMTAPGDEHWCGYCGGRRTIDAKGRPHYEFPE